MYATQPREMAERIIQNECKPVRKSQVQSELSRSGVAVDGIDKCVAELEARLEPVLRNEPAPPDGKGKDKMILVGHANALSNQNDQLESIGTRLSSILQRLEL